MPVEFVGGLRVSDARHRRGGQDGPRRQGQQGHRPAHQPPRPARGRALAATTASCSASRRQAGPDGEDIGFVGRDRARRRRRARATSPQRLHPGHRLGRRRPRGPLLQHQRRRGGGRGRARAGRLQGHVPHRRRAAGCATRPTPSRSSRERDAPTRSRPRCRRSPAACAQAAGLRGRDPRRRRPTRTSSTAACRTRCCSSCSPTPASARRSGRRA